jgi:hypothetical protein
MQAPDQCLHDASGSSARHLLGLDKLSHLPGGQREGRGRPSKRRNHVLHRATPHWSASSSPLLHVPPQTFGRWLRRQARRRPTPTAGGRSRLRRRRHQAAAAMMGPRTGREGPAPGRPAPGSGTEAAGGGAPPIAAGACQGSPEPASRSGSCPPASWLAAARLGASTGRREGGLRAT